MSLSLPANFENDIQSRDTALVPVISISSFDKNLFFSTNAMSIKAYQESTSTSDTYQFYFYDINTKPLLLNIPSLKESIDIEKRNYKISSINIDISNFPYEGERFSELVGDTSLINTECRVFWVSPSTTALFPSIFSMTGYDNGDEGFQIFNGTIRRYTHDDEKVKLVVEDRSQATLHRDLPLTNVEGEPDRWLGTDDSVPDKYKNKPIPMVYGHVDRSPCVISSFVDPDLEIEGQSSFIIKMDSIELDDKVTNDQYFPYSLSAAQSFLYISSGDTIARVIAGNNKFGYGSDQFSNSDLDLINAEIAMTSLYAGNGDSLNSLADNLLEVELERLSKTVSKSLIGNSSGFNNDESSLDNINTPISDGIDGSVDTKIEIDRHTVGRTYGTHIEDGISVSDFAGTSLSFIFDTIGLDSEDTKSWIITSTIMSVYSGSAKLYTYVEGYGRIEILSGSSDTAVYLDNFHNSLLGIETQWDIDNNISPTSTSYTGNFYEKELQGWNSINLQNRVDIYTLGHNMSGDYEISFDIYDTALYQRALIKNPLSQDFYANVKGREMASGGTSPTAPSAIKHILENELGVTGIDATDTTYDWKYAFTVDKKINSKKLIEGIASASPYIPRFNNMGEFKIDTIPMGGGTADHTIKEADVINFSFSRTPIEDVYTKVEFKYNWDYARGEFNSSIETDTDILEVLGDYTPDYYGFKAVDGIHAESTLIIDDDRGKYIREETTAQDFVDWYLLWSCNQHLKIKVKLPLKYMNLEIGDFVKFDAILGGVKPYGINYIGGGETVNHQGIFKTFLITSTNKTLEWVEIECIQMHNLDTGCIDDCNNVCNGGSVVDDCGICGGDSTSCIGCDGVPNSGLLDIGCGCGVALGEGNCTHDCNGDLMGSAYIDNCQECVGGNTGLSENYLMDECGECGGDGFGVCGENDCTYYDCSPCEGCKNSESINYESGACVNSGCLIPIVSPDFCPIEDLWGVPYDNWLCIEHGQQRCHFQGGATVTNNSVFNSSEYPTSEAMYEDIQQYCEDSPNFCNAEDYGEIDSRYPLVLSEDNCQTPISQIEVSKVELVHQQYQGSSGGIVHYGDNASIEIYPNNNLEFDSNILNDLGESGRRLIIRITLTYDNTFHNIPSIGISSTLNMKINDQQGGSCQQNEEWENCTDPNANPYLSTFSPQQNETVIELNKEEAGIVGNDWYEIPNWADYFCGDDDFQKHKFKIELQSSVGNDYVMLDMSENFDIIAGTRGAELGDVNGDGIVDCLDLEILAACVLHNECSQLTYPDAADINDDGGYNTLDLGILATMLLDLGYDCG